MHSFSKKELLFLAGAVVLLLPALLLNLGLVPLYAEEPRRAVVAMEMMFRQNWLVPSVNGELYFLKPPFFNWILAGLYSLAGANTEFITRVPTVISLLLLGWVIFVSGRRYVSLTFGALAAVLFMTAAGNLFFNSLLAEIDLFYSLVTFSSLVCLFHFHREKKYYLLFISVYFLGAIGVLTKGAPSLAYTGLSLLVWLSLNREFRKFFSPAHFAGLGTFLLIVGGYFYLYNSQGDVTLFAKSLTVESGKRFSGDSIWDYFRQLAWFPADTLLNLLPASLLVLFAARKSFFRDARENPLIYFSLVMLILHFPVYWLPPGGRQRYIIMLYPFMLNILVYFFLKYNGVGKWKIKPSWVILAVFLLVVARLVFNFTVMPVRATEGKTPDNRNKALMLADLTKKGEVCICRNTYFPMQCTYYLERERNGIVPRYHEVMPGYYHVVQKILLTEYQVRRDIGVLMENPLKPVADPFSGDDEALFSGFKYSIVKEFDLQKRKYLLVLPL